MASRGGPAMLLQAEKEFAQPIRLRLTRCCPTMDLVAVITNEEQLDVYRFNGQRAFGLQRKNASSTVSSVCWKYNGKNNPIHQVGTNANHSKERILRSVGQMDQLKSFPPKQAVSFSSSAKSLRLHKVLIQTQLRRQEISTALVGE
jgi:hypothetical protein